MVVSRPDASELLRYEATDAVEQRPSDRRVSVCGGLVVMPAATPFRDQAEQTLAQAGAVLSGCTESEVNELRGLGVLGLKHDPTLAKPAQLLRALFFRDEVDHRARLGKRAVTDVVRGFDVTGHLLNEFEASFGDPEVFKAAAR